MEDTVEQLQLQFARADNDLKRVQLKLEDDFRRTYDPSSLGQKMDPLRLLERLTDVRMELDALRKNYDVLVAHRQRVMAESGSLVVPLRAQLNALRRRAGLTEIGPSEAIDVLEGHGARTVLADSESVHETEEEAPAQASAQLRANGVHVAITREEFETVSALIRQRSKLGDLNKLYLQLFALASSGSGSVVTMSGMVEAGIKVAGQTGEAKLNTLRALGIVTRSKRGVVVVGL